MSKHEHNDPNAEGQAKGVEPTSVQPVVNIGVSLAEIFRQIDEKDAQRKTSGHEWALLPGMQAPPSKADQLAQARSEAMTARTGYAQRQAMLRVERLTAELKRELRGPMKLELASDIADEVPPAWLVHGIIPAEGVGTIYGAPKSLKSFVTLDLLAAVAEGGDPELFGRPGGWFGRAVVKRPTVYVPLEGRGGVPKRIKAWQEKNKRDAPFYVYRQRINLRDQEDRDEFVRLITTTFAGPVVLCIDTLAQMGGSFDENSSKDMGELIAILQELQARLPGSVILAVHHSGKVAERGMRGHSSFAGAVDFALCCERIGDDKSLDGKFSIALAKDGEMGTEFGFSAVPYEVEYPTGVKATSLTIVQRDLAGAAVPTVVVRDEDKVLEAIRQAGGKPMSNAAIGKATRIWKDKVPGLVKTLQALGRIQRVGNSGDPKGGWTLLVLPSP